MTPPSNPPLQLLRAEPPATALAVLTTAFDTRDSWAAYHAARRWRARAIGTLSRRAWRQGRRRLRDQAVAAWRWLTWGFRSVEEQDPFRSA